MGDRPHYAIDDVVRVAKFAVVHRDAMLQIAARVGCLDPQAEAHARRLLGSLSAGNYFRSYDEFEPFADAYGIRDRAGAWYLKFAMVNGRAIVLRCHEPEEDLLCKNGDLLPKRRK